VLILWQRKAQTTKRYLNITIRGQMLKLSDFDYTLPRELIAQYPSEKRDGCRLLVLDRKTRRVQHKYFNDIIQYFKKGDILILNDTKVIPARLIGKKITGGKVDCLLLEKRSDTDFSVLLKPSDIKVGAKVIFDGGGLEAKLIDKKILRFNTADTDYIYRKGFMPLPPYIKRLPDKVDADRYQTVFAKKPGAVAAPTAGLHFTEGLLSKIRGKGVEVVFVTLHINYATFSPVKEEDISQHRMYKEYYQVSKNTFERIRHSKECGGSIFCGGTTSARVLETLANKISEDKQKTTGYKGHTDLFIYPGYKFKMVGHLLTNFHLPRTTLLMLVSAFAGQDNIIRAYAEAIEKKYRFYSYGDAMLII
jgi:S-adenosylmethionine:tRNA ribosyltransferase-isomerase